MLIIALILFIAAGLCLVAALYLSSQLRVLIPSRANRRARKAMQDIARMRLGFTGAGLLLLLIAALFLFAGLSRPAAETPEDTQGTTLSTSAPTTVPTQPTDPTVPPTTTPQLPPPEITWMTFPEGRDLEAEIYFVYSCEQQTFTVLSGDVDQRVYPASVTKLFTAYVGLQILPKDQVITVGDAIKLIGEDASRAWLQKGHKLTMEDLVAAMLLPSGNDAAYAIAQAAGEVLLENENATTQQAVDAFLAEMNRQAKVLGMTGSHFVNPDGWKHEDHYTSVADLALIANLALADPVISKCAQIVKTAVPVSEKKTLPLENTNYLIDPDSKYYCPYAVGLKTGFTAQAKNCLLSAFTWNESTWVIGTFRCASKEGRYLDTLYLLNETIASLT